MDNACLPEIHAVRSRFTLLDASGVPLPGSESIIVVSSALLKVVITPVFLDGDDIAEKGGDGGLCFTYRGDDNFRRVDVQIELCTQDPYLSGFLSGTTLDDTAGRIGWAMPAIGPMSGNGIGIEVWSRRLDNGVEDAEFPYSWNLLPRVKNIRPGAREINGTARVPNIFTGQGYENPNWYDGPTNDWPGVASDRAFQKMPALANEVPDAACGPLALAAS